MTNSSIFDNQSFYSDYEQDTQSTEDINIKYHLNIIVPIIWSFIIIFGIIGNGLIIYIILKRRLYKNSCTNCYIINVSIADLCFTLVCVPVTMTAYLYKDWIFGEFMCHFQNMLMFSSIQAACLTLTAMTVDRYLAVLYPFKSIEYRTTKIAFMTNIIIWIASFTLNIPYYLYYKQENEEIGSNLSNNSTVIKYCVSRFPSLKVEIGLTLYTVLISYVLPLLTIIFCYMRMIIKIYSNTDDQILVEKSKNFSTNSSKSLKSPDRKSSYKNFNNIQKYSVDKQIKDLKKKNCEVFDEEIEKQDISNYNKQTNKIKTSPTKQQYVCDKNEFLEKYNQKNKKNYSELSLKINTNNQSNTANAIKKQKFKILLLIATVSITFALTWLPAHVIRIWKVAFNQSFPYNDTMYIIKLISHTLTYTNSIINPFIYVFIGSKFRSHIHSEINDMYGYFCLNKKKINLKNIKKNSRLSEANYVNILNVNSAKCKPDKMVLNQVVRLDSVNHCQTYMKNSTTKGL